jgi:hypothetical protein
MKGEREKKQPLAKTPRRQEVIRSIMHKKLCAFAALREREKATSRKDAKK